MCIFLHSRLFMAMVLPRAVLCRLLRCFDVTMAPGKAACRKWCDKRATPVIGNINMPIKTSLRAKERVLQGVSLPERIISPGNVGPTLIVSTAADGRGFART